MMTWIAALATATLLIFYSFALSLPDVFGALATKWILFGLILSAGFLVARLISMLVVTVALERRGRRVSQFIVLSVGVLFFLPVLAAALYFVMQAEVTALITTSALATAISGFALQATLGNFFEGLAIQLNRPFKIGDIVKQGTIVGVVEDMSWRSVRVRDGDGRAHVVPNNLLARQPLQVVAAGDIVQFEAPFSMPVGLEPGRVRHVVEDAAASVDGIFQSEAPQCIVAGFDTFPAAVRYVAIVSYEAKRIDPAILRSRVYERIWYALAREGFPLGLGVDVANGAPMPAAALVSQAERAETMAIAEAQALSAMTAETRRSLLSSARLLKYESGEHIRFATPTDLLLIIRGTVLLTFADPIAAPPSNVPRLWPRDMLEPVIAAFTRVMGPAGRQIVLQTASRAGTLGALYERLAAFVPDAAARAAFLAQKPGWTVVERGEGATLNAAAILADVPFFDAEAICATETSVLAINADILRSTLRGRPQDIESLAMLVADELAACGVTVNSTAAATRIRERLSA